MIQPRLLDVKRKPSRLLVNPNEFKVVSLRECPTPAERQLCDTPERVADYWLTHIPSDRYFNPDVESFVCLLLNTRRKVIGHYLVATGTLDTLLVDVRAVFRTAIVANAAAIVLTHNLCAATHKLCYVERRFMCSCRLAALTSTQILWRKELCGRA
jgi:hypothetical protein